MMACCPEWHISLILGHCAPKQIQDITMIGVLIFPNFQLLDAAGPISVFEIAARYAGAAPAIKTMAATPRSVRSSSGVEMLARGLKPSSAVTTLIVAGGEGARAAATCER